MRHWKLERLSDDVKAKLAFRALTVPVGPEVIVV
jgi:hypothetical protein